MSIIHSALKKAETEKQKRVEPYNLSVDEIVALAEKKVPVPPLASSLKSAASRKIYPIFWGYLLASSIILIGLVWGILLFSGRISKGTGKVFPANTLVKSRARVAVKTIHPPQPRQLVKPVQPGFFAPPQSAFHLTGIISGAGISTAVVNDKLVEVGDVVNGAQVISISDKDVTLEQSGKNVVVRLD